MVEIVRVSCKELKKVWGVGVAQKRESYLNLGA
jgi:hypothetical protein